MIHFLMQEPFMVEKIEESEKLARYLVEDNYDDYVELNYSRNI